MGTKLWHGEWVLWRALAELSDDRRTPAARPPPPAASSARGDDGDARPPPIPTRPFALLGDARSVIELGAGVGLCGVLLAAAGFDVTLTDRPGGATLTNMARNARTNAPRVAGALCAAPLEWTDALRAAPPNDAADDDDGDGGVVCATEEGEDTRARPRRRFDVALGADIVYEPRLFEARRAMTCRVTNGLFVQTK